jgi:hypothetical protein
VVDYDDMRQELDAEMLDPSEIVGGAEVDEMNSTEEVRRSRRGDQEGENI